MPTKLSPLDDVLTLIDMSPPEPPTQQYSGGGSGSMLCFNNLSFILLFKQSNSQSCYLHPCKITVIISGQKMRTGGFTLKIFYCYELF